MAVDNRGLLYKLNRDPKWLEYIQRFEPAIMRITSKYCPVESLREDCHQEARIALLSVFPENINGCEEYNRGEITPEAWDIKIGKYCRNAIRYSILSYLDSYNTGDWYVGRTRRVLNEHGERVKVHTAPRFSSLDELVDDHGMQIDEDGNMSWEDASTDGLN